jgi:hypothetical protein
VYHVQAARVRHPATPSSFVEENFRDADSGYGKARRGARQESDFRRCRPVIDA